MARLRDVPRAVKKTGGWWPFLKKVNQEVNDDNVYTWAAALAYSWLFAVFPFFIFLLTLIPLLKDEWKREAIHRIHDVIRVLPRDSQETMLAFIQPKLDQLLYNPPKGIWGIGLLITLWAASGGMAVTMAALNKCYDIEKSRSYFHQRGVAILLTMLVATMMLLVIILIPIGTVVTRRLEIGAEFVMNKTPVSAILHSSGVPGTNPATTMAATMATTAPATAPVARVFTPGLLIAWDLSRYGFGLLLMMLIVAIVYHFGPRIKQKWRVITPGSLFTVFMWLFLGWVFRFYVDRFGTYGKTYGAVGGVVVLLFIFYLDSVVLLVGAEINSEIDLAVKHVEKLDEKKA